MIFTIPDRMGSMTGSQFASTITAMGLTPARELAIYHQFELGNVPDFMRTSVTVLTKANGREGSFAVLPDVLCIGTDDDFVRVPMNPMTAQKIADLFTATLITPHMSDLIWLQAAVQLAPQPMPPTAEMSSTKWFVDHNAKIEEQRAGRGGLIAGHKKDVVLANTLALPDFKDKNVAIYGWHQPDGAPIQGLNPSPGEKLTHTITYADYSHGIRLAALDMQYDKGTADFTSLATDPVYSALFTGGTPLLYWRYPTN